MSQLLCMVNMSSLVINLQKHQTDDSIYDSDEEYYEIDEKENFHYNQELLDYDFADILSESFKFEPLLYFSKENSPKFPIKTNN